MKFLKSCTNVQKFEYDQLNRITASSTLAGANANTFKTGYEYDAGGNITKLKRWDKDGNQFDAIEYNYENTASNQDYKTNTNKLRWVDDTEPVADHTSDIDDQQTDNYSYNDIGQLIADKAEEIANIEWTAFHKVRKITRVSNSSKPDLEFGYDGAGNRVFKSVKEKSGDVKTSYYIRDGLKNVISIYEINNGGSLVLAEQIIGGRKILGVAKYNSSTNAHFIGFKHYELDDHLGNVHVVLSDLQINGNSNIISAIDYFPFGMKARTFNNGRYRLGYNKQEEVNEINGVGNYLDFSFRGCDPRLGRFFAVDPLTTKYPYNSPYAFAENRVVDGKELEGLEVLLVGNISSGGFIVGISKETGVIFAPDGIYGYSTWGGSVSSNMGGSTGLIVTFYPNMPIAYYATGWGGGAAIGGGEGITATGGLVYSSGYYGVQGTLTVGGKVVPVNIGAGAGKTTLTPLSGFGKEELKTILDKGRLALESELNDLVAESNKIVLENTGLKKENDALTEKLKTAGKYEKESIQMQINDNNEEINDNNVEIMEKNSSIVNIKSTIAHVDEELQKLK